MLNKKINIGVEELEEIEVGYDAAGGNMEVDQDEVPEGTLLFYDFVSSSSPLPVEDGHYDHIKYSHAWIWVGEEDKQGVADEFYRILSVGGTVFIRDYLARFDWEKGEEVELTYAQWMERLTTYFNESQWDIGPSMILADGFTVEITSTKKEESVNMEEEEKELYDPKVHNYGVDAGIHSDEDYKMISDKYSMFEVSGGCTFGDGINDLQLEFPTKAQAIEAHDFIEQYVDNDKDDYVFWYALNIHGVQVEYEEESVNMENKEHTLEMESARMGEDIEPEVTISYLEAVERAQQGTLPTCPHLEKVKVFKACYAECIIQYVFGTECNLPDGWEVEELGYLSYINMTNKDEKLQRMIDEYMDGDAGSCRKDCEHYKSCNE